MQWLESTVLYCYGLLFKLDPPLVFFYEGRKTIFVTLALLKGPLLASFYI